MAEYDENEQITSSQDDIAERKAQEEALRRLVRTEIKRIQSGKVKSEEEVEEEEEDNIVEESTDKERDNKKVIEEDSNESGEGGQKEEDEDEEVGEETKVANDEKKPKKRRWISKINGILTGDILLAEQANRVYNFLILLGVIFLISIFSMFGAFQQELRHNNLQSEVELLKERAIRASEARTRVSTHSAVLDSLKKKGIELEDPSTPPTILR